ncbi:hypothetical protein HYW61_00745 [candidate division WWE3 bacterium]|nr:hypothetical protein [candidate division WWE3 bacterium]
MKGYLNERALAYAFGIVGAGSYVLCALGVMLFPEFLLTLFNSWFHGVDLRVLAPADGNWALRPGSVILGLATLPLLVAGFGYFVAVVYNKLNK